MPVGDLNMKHISARKLFEINNRFDLIYKILFLENFSNPKTKNYYAKIYLDSIKTFNDYSEDDKKTAGDFLNAFVKTYTSIKSNGYDSKFAIPVNEGFQLYDGAHRLSIAYNLDMDVPYKIIKHNDVYDYKFFKRRRISRELADIGALEYVTHNHNAHIVQVFPLVNHCYDKKIEDILSKYGFIYYKKEIWVNLNGLIKIKQVNYGNEEWAGDPENGYSGLKKHAKECLGYERLRVYVFVCTSLDDAILAKAEVRKLINRGNFPIHINDSHDEAVNLANLFFNDNAIDWLNSAPYNNTKNQIQISTEFKEYCKKHKFNNNDICVSGSSILAMYGLRNSSDIDCISRSAVNIVEDGNVSSHETERYYYTDIFDNLVSHYPNFMTIDCIKYLSLKNILWFKIKRHEIFKDVKDILLIIVVKNLIKIYLNLSTFLYFTPVALMKRVKRH